MPWKRAIVAMAAISATALLAAACSGGGNAAPTPPGGFFGGGSDVTVTVGNESWQYKDGICEKGAGDAYLSLNAGNPATGEYFGLVAGKYPGAPATPGASKAATGGGEFTGQQQIVLNFKHNGRSYLAKFDATTATLAADISSGSFVSQLTSDAGEAGAVSGTFTCGK